MKRFIQGEHRGQGTLLPESLDDYVSDTNPVRVVDVFVDELDLVTRSFDVPFQPILADLLPSSRTPSDRQIWGEDRILSECTLGVQLLCLKVKSKHFCQRWQ
ncbi:hypothetical protein J2X87_005593 [Pseudomonas synxantha]|uniref:Uncharacterized protein n=1 Tax=Pseudomonas synxantha TaxID=47883 RepID=A0ACC6JVR2_9PSED|nr:hypothetical protein [Pseudomonas synxantha]MDR6610483.1 hypothetical protein [Pseudomonas synxantha]